MNRATLYAAGLVCVALVGCQTAKPVCPPPQIVEVKVPVVVPWPSPPTIPEPALECPRIDANTAPVNTILLAIINDLDAWKAYATQLREALKVYVQPSSQKTP